LQTPSKSRIGGKGAVTATAHKLASLAYRMLKHGKDYVKQSMAEYEKKVRQQRERSSDRQAAALGYQLIPRPAGTPTPALEPIPV
jgi:hypothetical protein